MNKFLTILAVLAAGFFGLTIVFGSWYTIEQGERGVLLRTGRVIAVTDPGLHFKLPLFDSVHTMSVRTEKRVYADVQAYSKDIQPSVAQITVNYHLQPATVAQIYSQYGTNYVERVLDPILMERTKESFGRYVAADIVTQREKLGLQIEQSVKKGMPEGLVIDGIQIENIDFSDAYEAAIEKAMQAEAEVRQVRQNLERERVQAETLVVQANAQGEAIRAKAKADADAIRFRGEAEAQAIAARGKALGDNPHLVTLVAAEKWNGILPTTQVPGAAVPFVSIPGAGR